MTVWILASEELRYKGKAPSVLDGGGEILKTERRGEHVRDCVVCPSDAAGKKAICILEREACMSRSTRGQKGAHTLQDVAVSGS